MSLPDPILRIEERERDARAWVGEAAAILREGDRLLADSGLHLQRPPRPPAPVRFIHLATPTIPQIWQPYLPGSATAA